MRNIIFATLLISESAFSAAIFHLNGKIQSFTAQEVALQQGKKVYHIKRSALPKDTKLVVGKEFALDVDSEDVTKTTDAR